MKRPRESSTPDNKPQYKKRRNLTEDERSEKLRKFKLEEIWTTYQPQLLSLGFTEAMIDKIIIRKSSANSVKAVVELSNTLLQLGFNLDNITDIASHNGGSKNLMAVTEHSVSLQALKFSAAQIVSMVAQ